MENQTQKPEAKLINPPESTQKKYKLLILRDCEVQGKFYKADSTVEVSKAIAKELLEFKVKGVYAFGGERDGDQKVADIRRAELIKEPSKEEKELF